MHPTLVRASRCVACCALAGALLTGCGGGGNAEAPRPTPTRSLELPTPDRTRTTDATSTPTKEPRPTQEPEPTDGQADRTRVPATTEQLPTEQPSPTEATTTEATTTTTATASATTTTTTTQSSTTQSSSSGAESSDDSSGTPASVWWVLLALVVIAGAATSAAVVRSRRKGRWMEDLGGAEGEVEWFAHTLLPELRRSRSLDQVVGGWQVGSARVENVEDRLTALEATAPGEVERSRAQVLRDAVRQASQRLDALTTVAPHETWALDLDDLTAALDHALRSADQPPPEAAEDPAGA